MPRPVKADSKCPRYWYFRERYLARKSKVKSITVADFPLPRAEIMTEAQWRAAKRPPSLVTWNELSAGGSNT